MLKGTQVVVVLSTAVAIIVFLTLGYNYLAIIICMVVGLCLQAAICLYFSFRCMPFLRFGCRFFSFRIIREVWPTAGLIFLGKISGLVYHQTPRLLIGIILNPAVMTAYEVVSKLPRFIKVMLGFVNSAVMPASSELWALKEKVRLSRLFEKGVRYQIYFSFPIVTGAIYLAEEFLISWVGSEFAYLSKLLMFLLIWNLFTILVTYGGSMFIGMNVRLKELALLSFLTAVLSIIVALMSIRDYQLTGVIVGYVSALLIIFPAYLHYYFKEFDTKYFFLIREYFFVTVLGLCPLFIVFLLKKMVVAKGLIFLIIQGLLWCFCYWGVIYAILLDGDERKLVYRIIPIPNRIGNGTL